MQWPKERFPSTFSNIFVKILRKSAPQKNQQRAVYVQTSLISSSQLYGHSRQGSCGVCQGIAMGLETPIPPRQFYSPKENSQQ